MARSYNITRVQNTISCMLVPGNIIITMGTVVIKIIVIGEYYLNS